jgi:hypothetical protein
MLRDKMARVKKEGHILRMNKRESTKGEYAHEPRPEYTAFCWQDQVQWMVGYA